MIAARNMRGVLVRSPNAQISGSALGFRALSFVDNQEPSGTPMSPATIVIAPNMNDTLKVQNKNIF